MSTHAPRIDIAEQAGVALNGEPRPTEDRVVVVDPVPGSATSGAAAVLDGATEQRPGLPSGGWYASRLAERLYDALATEPLVDTGDLMASAIAGLARDERLTPGASPSSTVALARWTPDTVETFVLGDSPVVAFGPAGVRVVSDLRLARLRAAGRLHTTEAVGRLRNRAGGFWVAEADPTAAQHAVRLRWPRGDVDALVLATDGVATGVADYGLFDWRGLRDLARRAGPDSVLGAVRAAERSDADRVRWPRPKRHDDQALVVVDFTLRSG